MLFFVIITEPDTVYEIGICPFTDLGDGDFITKNVQTLPNGVVQGILLSFRNLLVSFGLGAREGWGGRNEIFRRGILGGRKTTFMSCYEMQCILCRSGGCYSPNWVEMEWEGSW